jgi:hypothetical protein
MYMRGYSALAALAVMVLGLAACQTVSDRVEGHKESSTATAALHISPTPGQVTVAVDKTHYAPTDTIMVMIFNGLAASVSTTDHQTNCTVVTLERVVNGAWQAEGACRLLTPTRVVQILPGTTTQQLGSTRWPTGTYRVAFRYFMEPDEEPGQGAIPGQGGVVYSASFTLG